MLPHIEHKQWGEVYRNIALLIGQLLNDQAACDVIVTKNRPAGALQAKCCSREVSLELVEGTEVAVDSFCQVTGWLAATVWRKVLPEYGVVGVATQVERQVLGQCANLIWVCVTVALCFQSLKSSVCASYVGSVVLGVVQLHDLSGDVWLQCVISVIKFW